MTLHYLCLNVVSRREHPDHLLECNLVSWIFGVMAVPGNTWVVFLASETVCSLDYQVALFMERYSKQVLFPCIIYQNIVPRNAVPGIVCYWNAVPGNTRLVALGQDATF